MAAIHDGAGQIQQEEGCIVVGVVVVVVLKLTDAMCYYTTMLLPPVHIQAAKINTKSQLKSAHRATPAVLDCFTAGGLSPSARFCASALGDSGS